MICCWQTKLPLSFLTDKRPTPRWHWPVRLARLVVTRKGTDSEWLLAPDTPNQQHQQKQTDASYQPVECVPKLKNIMEERNENNLTNIFYVTANLTEQPETLNRHYFCHYYKKNIKRNRTKWWNITVFLRWTVRQKAAVDLTCWIKQTHPVGQLGPHREN